MGIQGNLKAIFSIIFAMITVVLGLSLAGVIISTAVTSGTTTGIGSFSNAANLNNLIPFLYYVGLVLVTVALFVAGVAGLMGKGPLKNGV